MLIFNSMAQDEWFFNRLLRKTKIPTINSSADVQVRDFFKVSSSFIKLDITGDGIEEYFRIEMVDGLYYVRILDHRREDVGRFKFLTKGYSARVYRVLRKHISKDVVVTLFYFFEGKTGYLDKYNTAGLYSFVVRDNDFKKSSFQRLTPIWIEKKDFNLGTYKRLYDVGSKDFNDDGDNELIVSNRGIKRIFSYDRSSNSMFGSEL